MVGTNNLSEAKLFYDIVLEPLELVCVDTGEDMVAYAPKYELEQIEFYVCKPFNKKLANNGNGTMVAFVVDSREAVERFHKLGLERGGANEGCPRARPTENDPYYAYIRDLDGNKICAYCLK